MCHYHHRTGPRRMHVFIHHAYDMSKTEQNVRALFPQPAVKRRRLTLGLIKERNGTQAAEMKGSPRTARPIRLSLQH